MGNQALGRRVQKLERDNADLHAIMLAVHIEARAAALLAANLAVMYGADDSLVQATYDKARAVAQSEYVAKLAEVKRRREESN